MQTKHSIQENISSLVKES